MRILVSITAIIIVAVSAIAWASEDYDPAFIRNYPPGYYGMWYKAQRFYENLNPTPPPDSRFARKTEYYRWDRFMSRATNTYFPFYPIPYDWEYGHDRQFNLPNYNTNDWR